MFTPGPPSTQQPTGGKIVSLLLLTVRSRLHVVLTLLLVELTLLLGCGILVLLVLRDKIVHVALSLGELHLIHTFSRVPVKECLAAEHGSEVLGNTFEHLLNGRGISQESNGHLKTLRRNVTNRSLDVVGNPLDKVGGVLVLHIQHLLINLFG